MEDRACTVLAFVANISPTCAVTACAYDVPIYGDPNHRAVFGFHLAQADSDDEGLPDLEDDDDEQQPDP